MPKTIKKRAAPNVYGLLMGATALAGMVPALLTYAVDPYEMFHGTSHPKAYGELAEKAHYPLWKFTHFDGTADTVILGDSRARALRNKYWHEFGATGAYNFAYGGGTIPEIYATFKKVSGNPNLKNLVVGIQLRSFDESHKGGMNRVPEAVKATASGVSYLKNWFVARKSWDFFLRKNQATIDTAARMVPQLISAAEAADMGKPGTTGVDKLLQPEICFGCDFPDAAAAAINTHFRAKGPNLGLGRGDRHLDYDIWRGTIELPDHSLPVKFSKQVEKNARSDWKTFKFSSRYMKMMEEIAQWADARDDRNLVFVVPPTIVEMQNTISVYGLASLDLSLRQKLSALAPVIDFDFPNDKTRQFSNFTDAYHFDSKFARQIVGEILMVQGATAEQQKRIAKRRNGVECPTLSLVKEVPASAIGASVTGQACRLWTGDDDV
ncbi:MAG: hypothetical protein ABJM29_21670 [Rhizobiaceae bacterium]